MEKERKQRLDPPEREGQGKEGNHPVARRLNKSGERILHLVFSGEEEDEGPFGPGPVPGAQTSRPAADFCLFKEDLACQPSLDLSCES